MKTEKSNTNKVHSTFTINLISFFWLFLGFFIIVFADTLIFFESPRSLFSKPALYHFIVLALSYFITVLSMRVMREFPFVHVGKMTIFFLFIFSLLGYLVVVPFASGFILFYLVFVVFGFFVFMIWDRLKTHFQQKLLLVVPGGISDDLLKMGETKDYCFIEQPAPSLPPSQKTYNGVVVDSMHPYSNDWIRFISACKLHKIPVYQAENVYESITGKTSLKHLSQGLVDTFNINPFYTVVKRCIDIFLIVATFPITALLMVIVAFAIRIESKGAVLFTQKRIGEAGKEFTIYKFRSMYADSETNGPQFAGEKDLRITKVGAFIRKFRLDELPQFWNILKGEMSLIGPRPEQTDFVREFDKEIPFYGYRHVIKPGISGWAQVTHGYASNSLETEKKVQYDLFYIKHFSFWIDMIIAVKTLKTIATGFGAR